VDLQARTDFSQKLQDAQALVAQHAEAALSAAEDGLAKAGEAMSAGVEHSVTVRQELNTAAESEMPGVDARQVLEDLPAPAAGSVEAGAQAGAHSQAGASGLELKSKAQSHIELRLGQ
jgi:hypothetical protein